MQAVGRSVQTMFVPFGIVVVMVIELGEKEKSDQFMMIKQKHSTVASFLFCSALIIGSHFDRISFVT
jgi:hypothetical protein